MTTARVPRPSPRPTKPTEPEGRAAVVETADGEMYLRDATTEGADPWKRAAGHDDGSRHRWDDLEVVAVRSSGYEAGTPGMAPETAAARLALALRPGVAGTRRAPTALAIYGQFAREVAVVAGPAVLADVVGTVEQNAHSLRRAA